MTERWRAFSAVYEGDAADQFRAGWQRSTAMFKDYVNQTQRIAKILEERIASLRETNKPEGSFVLAGISPRPGRQLRRFDKGIRALGRLNKRNETHAQYQQRLKMEAVHRANYLLRLVRYQLETDQETVSKTENVLDKLLGTCQEAQNIANETVANVRQALTDALAALKHWQAELELALAWLARAQRRLELAQIAYNQALMELSSAQSALRAAESNLRACRNDDLRKSCWGEEADVSRAYSRVRAAQAAVDAALREVRAAEEEVARAQARVDACTIAVNFSKQAVALADEAEKNALRAMNFAERGMEYAQAALKSLIDAKHALETEEEAVNEMSSAMRAATDSESEASHHLRHADRYETSAQRYAYIAQQALRQSISHLWGLIEPHSMSPALLPGIQ